MRCAVFGCNSDNQATNFDHNTRFHTFPKDDSIRQQWVLACCRQDKFNPNTARVCSKHFKSTDHERNLMHELLHIIPKKGMKLLAEAIPSVNIPKCESLTQGEETRRGRITKRHLKERYISDHASNKLEQPDQEFATSIDQNETTLIERTTLPITILNKSASECSGPSKQAHVLKELEASLYSMEILDRASPELWPEKFPGMSEYANGLTPLSTNKLPYSKELNPEDQNYMHQLASLPTTELISKVKQLHDIAYQLGVEEKNEVTRGKYLNLFNKKRSKS